MNVDIYSLYDFLEEVDGEEMVTDVSRVEGESAVGVSLLGGGERDLAVLHHLIHAVHLTHHAHRFCGERLLHNLMIKYT